MHFTELVIIGDELVEIIEKAVGGRTPAQEVKYIMCRHMRMRTGFTFLCSECLFLVGNISSIQPSRRLVLPSN